MGRALRPRLGTRKYWKKNQEFETKGLKEKKKKARIETFRGKKGDRRYLVIHMFIRLYRNYM